MRIVYLIVCVLVLLGSAATPATGQGHRERGGVYVQAAATRSGLVDRNASVLRYGGVGAGAASGWRRIHENSRIEIGLAISAGRLTSRITDGRSNREAALNLDVRLAAQRRVATLSSGGPSFFAGGQILLSALGRQHNFNHATETFADAFGTFSASGMWEARSNGVVLTGTATLPIVSAVGRTPYYGLKSRPDLRLQGPLSFTTVTHVLRIEKAVSPSVTVLVDYRTTFQRDDHPRPIRRIEHWLGTGVVLRRAARQ